MSSIRIPSIAAAALSALALLLGGAGAAQAAPVTLRTDPGGEVLTAPTTLRSTSADAAVFTTSAGSIACTVGNLHADVTSAISSSIIGGQVTALTFSACVDTLPTVNIEECALESTATLWITSAAGGGTFTGLHPVISRCKLISQPIACYFTFEHFTGTFSNADSSLTVAPQGVTSVSPTPDALGPGLCGTGQTFSTTFTHVVDAGNRTLTVTQS